MNEQVEPPPQEGEDATPAALITDFKRVYLEEYREIRDADAFADAESLSPSTAHGMSGIALSGGGIRSASFCLALQLLF